MVAVGDVQMLVGHQALDVLDDGGIGHEPEFGEDDGLAILGGEFGGGCGLDVGDGFEEQIGHVIGGIVIKAEDGREVGVGGAHEFETVFFGAGEGLFMRMDRAGGTEFLEPDAREESAPVIGGSGDGIGLLIGVDGGLFVLFQDAGFKPFLESFGGVFIGSVRAGILRRKVGKIDGDNIIRIARDQFGFVVAGKNIVGGRYQRGLIGLGIANGLEGRNDGHETSLLRNRGKRSIVSRSGDAYHAARVVGGRGGENKKARAGEATG